MIKVQASPRRPAPKAARATKHFSPLLAPIVEPAAAPAQSSGTKPQRQTKAELLRNRLSEPGGASLTALMQLTGWQAHTLRAAVTGLRKSGFNITRRREGSETIYAIEAGGTSPTPLGDVDDHAANLELEAAHEAPSHEPTA